MVKKSLDIHLRTVLIMLSMSKVRKRNIVAKAEPRLHAAIKAAAKSLRCSLGNYLLLAAEEKLAREEAAKQKDNAA